MDSKLHSTNNWRRCLASGENKNPNGCTVLFVHKCVSTMTNRKILNANRDWFEVETDVNNTE